MSYDTRFQSTQIVSTQYVVFEPSFFKENRSQTLTIIKNIDLKRRVDSTALIAFRGFQRENFIQHIGKLVEFADGRTALKVENYRRFLAQPQSRQTQAQPQSQHAQGRPPIQVHMQNTIAGKAQTVEIEELDEKEKGELRQYVANLQMELKNQDAGKAHDEGERTALESRDTTRHSAGSTAKERQKVTQVGGKSETDQARRQDQMRAAKDAARAEREHEKQLEKDKMDMENKIKKAGKRHEGQVDSIKKKNETHTSKKNKTQAPGEISE